MRTEEVTDLKNTPDEVQLALDLVETGSSIGTPGGHGRVTKQLPDGITSSMLYKDVIRIAWPSLVELTLTQLTSMVDLMMVGQLGPWAITAVGLTIQPKFLLMTMFIAMNVGATALVARYKEQVTIRRPTISCVKHFSLQRSYQPLPLLLAIFMRSH